MFTSRLFLCCITVVTVGLVTSFSIRRRSTDDKELAEALAILQRQRRRIGQDFLDPEGLYEGQPITLADVNEWLGRSRPEGGDALVDDFDSGWLPSDDTFKDFSTGPESYDVSANKTPRPVQPSNDELDDIFATRTSLPKRGKSKTDTYFPEKKKKEEMIDVKGDKTVLHKKSLGYTGDLSALGSLTREEIAVLMKAVQKLQNNALKVNNEEEKGIDSTVDEAPLSEEILVAEPASSEELRSVFEESDGPLTKETSIIVEKQPGDKQAKVIKQETISNDLLNGVTVQSENNLSNVLTDELENEIEEEEAQEEQKIEAVVEAAEQEAEEQTAEAEERVAGMEEALRPMTSGDADDFTAENDDVIRSDNSNEETNDDLNTGDTKSLATKYWLMNTDNFNVSPGPMSQKRTAKRAVDFPHRTTRDRRIPLGAADMSSFELNLSSLSATTRAFVEKILTLQSEVDRLKMLSRLEDMENDFLADALNEATMVQKEGSVTDTEWTALQQAIRIEEALQEVKKDDDVINLQEAVRKRGEPWRRKRQPLDEVTDDDDDDDERVHEFDAGQSNGHHGNGLVYRPLVNMDEIEDKPEAGVASLFMTHADQCPAIQKYSTNCELASIYLLPIDYEARSLCNLHEMCYACGHSLGVTQSQCDLVYRAAGATLCEQDESCVVESDLFLRAMKLKTRYVPHEQPSCRSPCTARFLGMF